MGISSSMGLSCDRPHERIMDLARMSKSRSRPHEQIMQYLVVRKSTAARNATSVAPLLLRTLACSDASLVPLAVPSGLVVLPVCVFEQDTSINSRMFRDHGYAARALEIAHSYAAHRPHSCASHWTCSRLRRSRFLECSQLRCSQASQLRCSVDLFTATPLSVSRVSTATLLIDLTASL